jgi:hypothetical protein
LEKFEKLVGVVELLYFIYNFKSVGTELVQLLLQEFQSSSPIFRVVNLSLL